MKAHKDFTVTREKKGPLQVLRLVGPLDDSRYERLRSVLQSLYQEGLLKIIIDCDSLDHMSTTALQSLGNFVKQVREAEGEVILTRVPEDIKEIINLLGYGAQFKTCEQEKEAINILAPQGTGEDETPRLKVT